MLYRKKQIKRAAQRAQTQRGNSRGFRGDRLNKLPSSPKPKKAPNNAKRPLPKPKKALNNARPSPKPKTSDSAKPRFGGPAPKPRIHPWTHGAPRTKPRTTPSRVWGAPPTTTRESSIPSWWSQSLKDSNDRFMDSLSIQRGQKKQKALKDKVKTLKPRNSKKPIPMPKAYRRAPWGGKWST